MQCGLGIWVVDGGDVQVQFVVVWGILVYVLVD